MRRPRCSRTLLLNKINTEMIQNFFSFFKGRKRTHFKLTNDLGIWSFDYHQHESEDNLLILNKEINRAWWEMIFNSKVWAGSNTNMIEMCDALSYVITLNKICLFISSMIRFIFCRLWLKT